MVKTVYTSGVFDLLHAGHIDALERARTFGDRLLVGVHSDEEAASYKRIPVIPYAQRFKLIESLQMVDQVIFGPLYETTEFYSERDISVHCQGGALDGFFTAARELGILKLVGRSPVNSSTGIIEKIRTGQAE